MQYPLNVTKVYVLLPSYRFYYLLVALLHSLNVYLLTHYLKNKVVLINIPVVKTIMWVIMLYK